MKPPRRLASGPLGGSTPHQDEADHVDDTQPTRPLEPLLTIDDLAELLGLTARAVYNRRHRQGALPPVIRIGRNLRWRRRDVEIWLDAQVEDNG